MSRGLSHDKEFPWAAGDSLFLNHCMVSPTPTCVLDSQTALVREYNRGVIDIPGLKAQEVRCRTKLASMLNAHVDEVALTHNTTFGINIVARGVAWRPGDNVVTSDIEFPSNAYPWLALDRLGVDTRLVGNRDGRIETEDVVRAIDDRTRVVALSLIQFSNGFRIDAREIGRYCRERGVLFLLDAAQALGALRVDVQDLYADFVASGAHKFLLGPLGSGVFYCRKQVLEQLTVLELGKNSVPPGTPYVPYSLVLRPDAARFSGGSPNPLGNRGLEAAVDLITSEGVDSIECKLASWHGELRDALQRLDDVVVTTPMSQAGPSSLTCFRVVGETPAQTVSRLAARGIEVSSALDNVRIAPHCYHQERDVERLVAAIANVSPAKGIRAEGKEAASVAAQLRCPQGDAGAASAASMELRNACMTVCAQRDLAAIAGERIVEIGPGTGMLSLPLARALGPTGVLHVVEHSEDMATLARRNLERADGPQVIVHRAEWSAAKIDERSVDGVVAVNVIYFVPSLHEVFAVAHTWLRPGGRLVIGVRSQTVMERRPYRDHIRAWSSDEVMRAMAATGFEDIGCSFTAEADLVKDKMRLPRDSITVRGTRR